MSAKLITFRNLEINETDNDVTCGVIFCFKKRGAKYLAEFETVSVRSKNLTRLVSWDFSVWGTRYIVLGLILSSLCFFYQMRQDISKLHQWYLVSSANLE